MTSKIRYFRVADATPESGPRIIIPPRGLLTGPGAQTARLVSGETFEVTEEKAREYGGYLRGRIRAGDLVEVKHVEVQRDVAPPNAAAPPPTTPQKKEG